MKYRSYIENNTLRCEAGYRGGGIEIDLAELLPEIDNPLMAAYQNYLGGGLLGRICSNVNFDTDELTEAEASIINEVSEDLKEYFHELTNHDDEWESETYEQNQRKPVSAY